MKFAFCDPPYPGRAYLYRDVDRPDAEEVDHAALVDRLIAEYPDGWALATDSRGLWTVVPLLEPRARELRARIGIWHVSDALPIGIGNPKGRDARVAFSFEAVVLAGGRHRGPHVYDVLVAARRASANPFLGAKPGPYVAWVLRLLGAEPGDVVDDLYGGSGAVAAAAAEYLSQAQLWPARRPRAQHMRRSGKLRSSRGWSFPQEGLPIGEVAGG